MSNTPQKYTQCEEAPTRESIQCEYGCLEHQAEKVLEHLCTIYRIGLVGYAGLMEEPSHITEYIWDFNYWVLNSPDDPRFEKMCREAYALGLRFFQEDEKKLPRTVPQR